MKWLDLKGNAVEVAPELLNCFLCIEDSQGDIQRHRICEVEAYHGFEDKASHAHRGETPRNAVMFGPPGYWYVYLCYGVHWLLNLVTAEAGYPSAVLIRGAGPWVGPGRLTRALGIDRRFGNRPAERGSGLWLEPVRLEKRVNSSEISRSPRIGIDRAGEPWVSIHWRFFID
jgi:DNA-3-methyladenine glycosylase